MIFKNLVHHLLIYALCCLPCALHAGETATPIKNKATVSILTPQFEGRKTAKIQLENGLQAYLISDPKVDSSSAALVVQTGSWEDPVEYPGIAHFLEHMLFLGTKKYPDESEYSRYLSEHGGQYNAFTSNDYTGYIFSINNSAFPETLDRFSSFFTEPLFNPSGVDRELEAINQEYAKNIENDDFREYFVLKELANPAHPMHAFSMGNRESLLKVSQETLKNWYKQHYSANRMRLEVISNLPLEQIQSLVIADFSSVPNHNLPPISVDIPFIPDDVKAHMIYIEPIKNVRQLTICWELPQKFADMRDTRPGDVIGHILGHEGKKSLLAQLKKEKLADEISAGTEIIGARDTLFSITINLTDAGVKNVNTVILRCFEAIARLKADKVPRYLFDEMQTMALLNYQYQEREEAFGHILKEAMILPREDMSTFPEQTLIIQKFDPKAIEEMLKFLTPENAIFDLIAPKNLTGVPTDRKEQWLGANYALIPVPHDTLNMWRNAARNPQIDLPEPNPYIPENVNLISYSQQLQDNNASYVPHPALIIDNDQGQIYFAQDTYYSIPTVSWTFEIKTPAIKTTSPSTIVLGDLFVKYVTEALSEYTYPATMGGLNFAIQRTDNGLSISIDGYSDKADELFFDIIRTIKKLRPREQKFKTYKDSLLRQYQDASLDKPIMQDLEILRSLLHKDYILEKTKAIIIRKITFDDLDNFVNKLFENTYVEGIIYGNTTESQVKDFVSRFLEELASSPYPKAQQYKKEVIVLPDDKGPFFVEVKSKVQGNALLLAIELEEFSFSTRAAQQILMQAIQEPFYTALRTKQQTGYIVISKAEDIEQHLFNLFGVQSNSHDGRDLLARFELFLEGFLQEISKTEVTTDRFNNIKNALITMLRQPPQSTTEMGALLYKLAFSYNGDFDRIAKRIQAFEDLSYEDFIKKAGQMIGKENKHRLAVLLQGTIPNETSLQYTRIADPLKMKQLVTYEPSFQDLSHE
ncbi:MAG: insulinase family protein [Parachlamydiaceae bacterium]